MLKFVPKLSHCDANDAHSFLKYEFSVLASKQKYCENSRFFQPIMLVYLYGIEQGIPLLLPITVFNRIKYFQNTFFKRAFYLRNYLGSQRGAIQILGKTLGFPT